MRWLIRRYVLLLSFRLWRVAGWWRLSFCCCCCWLGMRLVDGMVGNRLLCGYHWLCSSLTFASVLDMGCCWLGVWDWLDGIGFSFNVVATNSSRRMCWRRLYLGCFCPESRLRIWCVFFFWLVFEMFYSSDCHTFFFFVVGFSMGDFLIGARAVVLPFPLFRWHRVLISLVFCNSTSSRCSKPMWSRHYRNVRRSCRISSWDIISRFRLVLPSLVSCWIFFLGALFFQEGFRFAKTLDDVLDARVFFPRSFPSNPHFRVRFYTRVLLSFLFVGLLTFGMFSLAVYPLLIPSSSVVYVFFVVQFKSRLRHSRGSSKWGWSKPCSIIFRISASLLRRVSWPVRIIKYISPLLPFGASSFDSSWQCHMTHLPLSLAHHRGLIGPSRQFGDHSIYNPQLYALVVGALLPIPFWFWQRKYPNRWNKFISTPVVLNAVTYIPPATGINYSSWFAVGFLFQYYVRRRNFAWWSKFNYVTAAAMDSGEWFFLFFL